jgi:hypothetical protein
MVVLQPNTDPSLICCANSSTTAQPKNGLEQPITQNLPVVDQWVFLIVPAVVFFESLSRSSESETTCTWVVAQRRGTAWDGQRGPILGGGGHWRKNERGERKGRKKNGFHTFFFFFFFVNGFHTLGLQ